MELLDLPPELFQKIIASYVHTVGICKAWERRKVCSKCYRCALIAQAHLF